MALHPAYIAALNTAFDNLYTDITYAIPLLGSTTPKWARTPMGATLALAIDKRGRGRATITAGAARSAHATLDLKRHTPRLCTGVAQVNALLRNIPALDHPLMALRFVHICAACPEQVGMDIARKTLGLAPWARQQARIVAIASRCAHLDSAAGAPLWKVGANTIPAPSAEHALLVHQILAAPQEKFGTNPGKMPMVARIYDPKDVLHAARALAKG